MFGPARRRLLVLVAGVALFAGALGGCAADPKQPPGQSANGKPAEVEDVNDPLERVNRGIFQFNEYFYQYVLDPITTAYEWLPGPFRLAVHNFLANLTTPVILANDLMQGEGQRAMETIGRAVVNTTAGVGGVIDMGAELGVKRHKEDFGQTMGVWGVGEGFYVVLPVLGPSNPRDAIGKLGVDPFLDPLGYYLGNIDREDLIWARTGTNGVDEYSNVRDELKQVKKTSIDYYAAIRSLYRQKRKAEISNGRDIKLPPIPDLTYDLDPEPTQGAVPLPRVAQ